VEAALAEITMARDRFHNVVKGVLRHEDPNRVLYLAVPMSMILRLI